jgi:polar amino acid transport system substrate-binding protein
MIGEDGKLQGFSIDVARKLAEDLAVEPEWVTTSYVDLPVALDNGDCQVIISGISATPDRALFANFTNPIRVHEIRLSPSARRVEWKSPLDFNRPDVTIGAMEGSMALEWAKKVYPKAKVHPIAALGDLLTAAMEDRYDAATSPGPELLAKVSSKVGPPLETAIGRRAETLAVRRGDADFLAYLNTWVQTHTYDEFFKERGNYWLKQLGWPPAAAPQTSK